MSKMSLLFSSSEVYPFAKSGGLADVAYSLPRVLSSEYDVHVFMPLYQFINRERFNIKTLGEHFNIMMGGMKYPVELYGCKYEGLDYRFIYSPLLCDREFLYGPPEGCYKDNAIRFGIFNYAIVTLLKRDRYDIAHLNDWQSALVPLLINEDKAIQTKTLFTIHNLAYQGVFESSVLKELGIDDKYFSMEGLEFYGQVNFMKAGIAYADMITTVSPTYAKEILTTEFGCGLEGFLRVHRNKLAGIVNGIDMEHFSPSDDKALIAPYVDLRGKAVNKRVYLKDINLKGINKPLFIFIGRFTWQKGIDLLIEALSKMVLLECNIAILGEGEEKYYDALKIIAEKYSNVHLEFGYDESLSHRMYAAADFLLMPSLFEPCGLAQMIAMHYGQIPIVHHVGGLVDTVYHYEDFNAKTAKKKGYGIVFSKPSVSLFLKAIDQALALYKTKKIYYNKVVKYNMLCDFSWNESAKLYVQLYRIMIKSGIKLLEERSDG
ncbi:glycogen/starch synthase [Sulfurovum sp.]|uniref:glycogen synthase n=1 Tax=Sulfurovum sp. TaxID=1969726 RepID=UPI002867E841|nr:glycogen/starch synthase [Sulfurovum sp.]